MAVPSGKDAAGIAVKYRVRGEVVEGRPDLRRWDTFVEVVDIAVGPEHQDLGARIMEVLMAFLRDNAVPGV